MGRVGPGALARAKLQVIFTKLEWDMTCLVEGAVSAIVAEKKMLRK